MSIHLTPTDQYSQQLCKKAALTQNEFADFYLEKIEVFDSPPTAFRMRAEFKVWHQNGEASYAMYQPGEYKKPFIIDNFQPGSKTIQQLMPVLLKDINRQEILKNKLFQVEFLTSQKGSAVATLIYHKPLDGHWHEAAVRLARQHSIHLIGRSRKQKLIVGESCIFEEFNVNGDQYKYQQVESSFTQPNAAICEKMLNWAQKNTVNFGGDLLELYCGNGNFTLPLAKNFNKVIATEISKTSIHSAKLNCQINNVTNIEFLRMSSEEFTQAFAKEREFRRLKEIDLGTYNISTVFVDPPRAGLDHGTLALISKFENIVYISCNPETLRRDLQVLSKTHKVNKMALFDQFPYTDHRECAAILRKY